MYQSIFGQRILTEQELYLRTELHKGINYQEQEIFDKL